MIGVEVYGYDPVSHSLLHGMGGLGVLVHEASRYQRPTSGLNQMA